MPILIVAIVIVFLVFTGAFPLVFGALLHMDTSTWVIGLVGAAIYGVYKGATKP